MAYNTRIRQYADGSSEVIVSEYAFGLREREEKKSSDQSKTVSNANDELHSFQSSVGRSKKTVEILGRANHWDWFFTLTFNDEKVNALDYECARSALEKWFDCARKRHPGMKYLSVLEMGKKHNRWHAHILIANADFSMVDSGNKSRNHKVYNLALSEYNLGFTTATKVLSSGAAGRYISKYIGKALGETPKNSKRYWASRNLITEDDITAKYLLDNEKLQGLMAFLKEHCSRSSHFYISVIDNRIDYFHFNAYVDFESLMAEFGSSA